MNTSVKTLVKTGSSYLNIHDYEFDENCVRDVCDKLLEKPEIIVFGKICHQNRSVGFFSDVSVGYKYSGRLMRSSPMTDNLRNLLRDINEKFETHFNGILVNRYEDGTDYISAHSDDEKGILVNDVVAISWGISRTFRIRNKSDRKIVANIPTESGHIIHMGGEFQREFTHEIPVEKKKKGIRYSFTFRYHAS